MPPMEQAHGQTDAEKSVPREKDSPAIVKLKHL
jgi:hypothetical protein